MSGASRGSQSISLVDVLKQLKPLTSPAAWNAVKGIAVCWGEKCNQPVGPARAPTPEHKSVAVALQTPREQPKPHRNPSIREAPRYLIASPHCLHYLLLTLCSGDELFEVPGG